MRRNIRAVAILATALLTLSPVASAQQETSDEAFAEHLRDLFDLHQFDMKVFMADTSSEVSVGALLFPEDSGGDGEFSTGEDPGIELPGSSDIKNFLLADTEDVFFGSNGPLSSDPATLCAPPGFGDDLRVFCAPQLPDMTALGGATQVATFQFHEPPGLFNTSQLCEWVVWYRDPSLANTFERLDQFPNDPADGTNRAFGLRQNFGEIATFALELTDQGFFTDVPTNTVAVFESSFLTLVTPDAETGSEPPEDVRAYTFCTDGQFNAAGSVADTTVQFTPPAGMLVLTEPTPPSTTTSTTSTTTTTTTQPSTTTTVAATETTQEESEGGDFPWPGLIFGGLALIAVGVWLAARKKGCEDELRAWQAAQKACDDANKALEDAKDRAERAEKARDDAEDEIEKLCDAMPPVCWEGKPEDTYVEDPEVPGSRIDRLDLFVKRAWGKANWKKYRDGEMTAQEVEDAWGEDPPEEFGDNIRKEYEKAKDKKSDLDKDLEKAQKELDEAESAVTPAEAKAKDACDKAAKAKAAYDECMKKASAAPPATGGGTTPGPTPGPTPGSTPGGQPEEPPCSPDNTRREVSSETLRVNVPIRLEPMIAGGHAHAASEQADEIGSALQQAEIGAKAIGRIFSFGGSGKVVTDFSAGAAADLAAGAVSEAKGIPIPTNIPTAVANVTEVVIKAARVSITKVLDLQERRLPDVDLSIKVVKATYVLTCTKMQICKNSTWVDDGTRLTVEAGEPRTFGTKRYAALTWAESQEKIAEYAQRVFRRDLQRSIQKMADFQKKCAEGG